MALGVLFGGVGASAALIAPAEDAASQAVAAEADVEASHAAPAPAQETAGAPTAPAAVEGPGGPVAAAAPSAVERAEPAEVDGARTRQSADGPEAAPAETAEPVEAVASAEATPSGEAGDALPPNPFDVSAETPSAGPAEPTEALAAAQAPPAAGPEPARAASPERPEDLAGLMEHAAALPEEPAAEPAQRTAEPVRTTPTRAEVTRALEGIHAELQQCAGSRHGLVHVELTVASSGRVRSALVNGAFAGSPEGSCMARIARSVRFEPFEEDGVVVRYPFRF